MSDPQPARRTGIPLLEVGIVGLALIGIALFIWRGLEKSRETAMRGVAKAELNALGFTISNDDEQFRISAIDIHVDKAILNNICVFKEATHLSLHNSWIDGNGLKQLSELKELQTPFRQGQYRYAYFPWKHLDERSGHRRSARF